ncbi:hypothetical protein MLD38_039579 [Melastoma candidum]|uniref:Uncharacterized protein n=1 Tax=Melastoma candidum TaxID=119954 RepID=A0ACB9L2Y6_9MYRT|nr:hypothetical protein MLD38_039579 [Melastoma candidum]
MEVEGEVGKVPRHSCLKLHPQGQTDPIFVKATWHDSHFDLLITDGLRSWVCRGTEEEVRERAAQWDQPVSDYIHLSERYFGFQHPDSLYRFCDGTCVFIQRLHIFSLFSLTLQLSWTFEEGGIKLEWRWKCRPSPDCKKTTAEVLDFLMDANIKLSEEVVSKTKSFERLKEEAEKCLAQSERFRREKVEFEDAIYAKKAKLRELQDKLAKEEVAEKPEEEDDKSTEETEELDEEISDEEMTEYNVGSSKEVSRVEGGCKKRTRGSCEDF